MSTKSSVMIAIAVSGLVTFGALAHSPDHQRHHMRWMANELNLTDAQKQDLRALMRQGKQDAAVYREDLKAMQQELQAFVSDDGFEQSMVSATLERYKPVLLGMAEQRFLQMQQMQSLLSAEQRSRLLELHQERENNRFSNRFEERQERMLQRLADKLALGDDQDDVLVAIEEAMTKRRDVHHVKRELFHSLRSAQLLDDVDDSTFNSAFEQFYSDLVSAATNAVVAARDVLPMLTEEQQTTFLKLMNKDPRHRG
ncbi:MAG: Spy/CpxP family protein refolding chaperone [Aestuariibacter sp.]